MKLTKSVFTALLIMLISQCSTEKNTVIHRGFHNLHAKYNGFFNANELIKTSYNNFLESRKEDYNEILPVFPFTSNEEAKNWYAPMDTAYKKCELVIFKHRMPHKKRGKNRNKEWGKFIDDNWMTMGKTRYYKHDFPSSLKIFQHIENKYSSENNYYESIFWQAKVLIEMQAFDEAEEILLNLLVKYEEQLKNLKNKSKTPTKEKIKMVFDYEYRMDFLEDQEKIILEKTINKIYPTLAALYIKSKNNLKAIEYLELALDKKYKKRFKTRLTFILAQLYHQKENYKASYYYQEVVESNPEYEMAFQAKINRALSFSKGDSKAIKAQLMKMLKDDKNIEYFDQIYYALAEISFKENQKNLGIEQLQKSINLSLNDPQQKIKSMRRMGDLFYDDSEYINSFLYYDSIQKIPLKKYRDQELILKRYQLLKDIYLNELSVSRNDSLLDLCSLSEEERNNKLYEIVEMEISKKKEVANTPLLASNSKKLSAPNSNSVINTSFFIWDQGLLQRGKNEFEKKWGKIIFEDNWRRSSKTSLFFEENEETNSTYTNNELFEELLKSLPCENKELRNSMEDSVLLSLYNLGLIHHYETQDLVKAIKKFNRIVENYQPKMEAIASIYELHNIFYTLNKTDLSLKMKKLLLEKYPKSKYAKLLLEDGISSDVQNELTLEKNFYSQLYNKFQTENYNEVLASCNNKLADSNNILTCQYGLLKAYTLKKLNDTSANNQELISTLKFVVEKCLGTFYGDQANNALSALKVKSAKNLIAKKTWNFNYNPDTIHYFVMIAPKNLKINKAKNNIADFNMSNFSDLKLKVFNTFLNTSDQMVMVKFFKNSQIALDYYVSFKVNKGNVKNYKNEDFFLISPNNLKELYLEKNPKNYIEFFNAFYQ
ncbi:MAG: hypothetical protein CL827_09625 [Crocinitomicaceae bacterium]|nr:hypothetical protein [Crocinitomicaceae bacterium]